MTGPDLGPVRPDGDHSGTQTGGKKKRKKRRKNLKGGKGSGHDVHLPSEFFGKNSGRYFEKGDSLILKPSAYGPQHATSHGMAIGNNMLGPDLGAHLGAVARGCAMEVRWLWR